MIEGLSSPLKDCGSPRHFDLLGLLLCYSPQIGSQERGWEGETAMVESVSAHC